MLFFLFVVLLAVWIGSQGGGSSNSVFLESKEVMRMSTEQATWQSVDGHTIQSDLSLAFAYCQVYI